MQIPVFFALVGQVLLGAHVSAFSIGFKQTFTAYSARSAMSRCIKPSDPSVGFARNPVLRTKMTVMTDQNSGTKLKDEFWNWNGYKIRYQASGVENTQGPSILLIHGFGGNADHWRKNTPNLARMANARVFAIDLIGYGYSDKPDPKSMDAVNGELRRDLTSYARFAPEVYLQIPRNRFGLSVCDRSPPQLLAARTRVSARSQADRARALPRTFAQAAA